MSKGILIWFWSGGGGGSQFAVRLAQRLARRRGADRITLSLREDDPTLPPDCNVRVLRAAVLSDRKRPLASLAGLTASAAMLEAHLRATQADVVVLAMNFTVAAPLALRLKAPLVYCAHDPLPHAGDFAVLGQRLTQDLILRRADTVVALSHYGAGLLSQRRGLAAKLRVAPLASVYAPSPRPARGSGPVRFVLAGRMIAYKGLDVLAGALKTIAERDDWRLVVAGAGPALTAAARAALAGPQVDIRPGWLDDAALEALLADADVLLAPYTEASQSGLVAQALSLGVPVLATPVGALPEQIGRGGAGWLANDATPEAFGRALRAVLDAPAERFSKASAACALAEAAWAADTWDWLSDLK